MPKIKIIICFVGFCFSLGFIWLLVDRSEFFHQTPRRGLSEAIEQCGSIGERTKAIVCFRKELSSIVKSFGVRKTMDELQQVYTNTASNAQDLGGFSRCHDIAHAVGQSGLENSMGLSQALGSCTSLCTSGCYHGVVEGFIARGGDLTSVLETVCQESLSKSLETNSCFHGVGHGIASVAGFNLTASLKLCDHVLDSGRVSCGAGVIMELYEPSSFDHALLEFPDDIPKFCQTIQYPYRIVCEQTAGLHEYSRSGDVESGILACQHVPPSVRDDCVVALGQNMYFVFDDQIDEMVKLCVSHGKDFELPCRKGILLASVMSDPLHRYANLFCEKMNDSDKCMEDLAEILKKI